MANELAFGGEEHFAVSPEQLFDTLVDLDHAARWIPDLESSQRIADDTLACVVRPGFSFLRGTLKVEMKLADVSRPSKATVHTFAKAIGAAIEIVARWEIVPGGKTDGCVLRWSAEVVQLRGLLATVGKSLIRAAAEQVIRQTWPRVRASVEASAC